MEGRVKAAVKYLGDRGIKNTSQLPGGGLDLAPEKACEILHDGSVHGEPLTEAQRGLFGAKCGERTENVNHPDQYRFNEYLGGLLMALTKQQRSAVINNLTANCDCWKGDGGKEILEQFSDDRLLAMQDQASAVVVANVAVRGVQDSAGNALRVNPETGRWERRKVEQQSPTVPSQNQSQSEAQNGPGYMKEEEEEEEDEEEDGEEAEMKKKNKKRMMGQNAAQSAVPRKLSREQILNALPPDMREQLRVAEEVTRREKDQIIAQIISNSNIAEPDKRAHYDRLYPKSVDELRYLLSLFPQRPSAEEMERVTSIENRKRRPKPQPQVEDAEEDLLVAPTFNWNDQTETKAQGDKQQSHPVTNYDEGPMTVEEEIRTLSPRLQRIFQAAAGVEQQEREKLLRQLTANVEDEEAEQRLYETLRNKPIGELQALLALAGRQERQPPNYFGAAGGGGIGQRSAPVQNAEDDVLPLPQWNWKEVAEGKAI